MTLPLEGVKVLDLTRMAPGPFCTMVLGDLGADVLKVEEVGLTGRRAAVPGALERVGWLHRTEQDAAYDAMGRNKKSIALNLKDDKAREVFYKLAKETDVLIEEFRPGVVNRLGVDYDTIKEINPQVIYCSVTGYGQTGPYRDMAGHDLNYTSTAGAQGVIGTSDGQHAIPWNLLADYAGGGLIAAVAVLGALVYRHATGQGKYVDVAMTDGVIYLMAEMFSDALQNGSKIQLGKGKEAGGNPRYNVYRTKDEKFISIASLEPWFYQKLCQVMGLEELAPFMSMGQEDERVQAAFKEAFKTKTRDQWFDILAEEDTCVGRVYSLDEVPSDPQVQAREMVIELNHPSIGKVQQVGVPFKYAGESLRPRNFSPMHGENTSDVLVSLGYSGEEIKSLKESGAVK